MYNDALRNNPLASHADAARAAEDCVRPYLPFVARGENPGVEGASYRGSTIRLETVSRLLWAAAPLAAGTAENGGSGIEIIARAVAAGTDPENSLYWGVPAHHDQILVEMPAIALALLMAPETFRDALSRTELDRTLDWLSWTNRREVPVCNWLLFGLIVNAALVKFRPEEVDRKRITSALTCIESFYLGDGWYNDGSPAERRSRDYYIPWAYYYFGLIFIAVAPDFDPRFTATLGGRAREFAPEYRAWFAPGGAALPFGRSLTYRYAQAAFWGALAYSGIEALPWAEVRGLWARNLRWWFGKPFFSETGLQEVGYAYPNRYMAERYNSPASPLWALQAFLPLATGPDHPFWTQPEAPYPEARHPGPPPSDVETLFAPAWPLPQTETGFILTDLGPGHRVALSAGQWTPGAANEHGHMAEKYEKFTYSTAFAFNVAVDETGYDKIAPDNTLLLSGDGEFFRRRKDSRDHEVTSRWCRSSWRPFDGVSVETWQVPAGPWILRVHLVETADTLFTLEGGFPLPYEDGDFPPLSAGEGEEEHTCVSLTALGVSGLRDAGVRRQGVLVNAFPNSNILHPHVVIPTLRGTVSPGSSALITLVTAHPDRDEGLEAWRHPPDLSVLMGLLPERVQAAAGVAE